MSASTPTNSKPVTTPASKPGSATAGSVREITAPCPYVAPATVQDDGGERVGRGTILTTGSVTNPSGCRYYWQYDDSAIIAQITVKQYPTAIAAYNAMVLSAKGHPEVVSDADIGRGAVAIKTELQGSSTWQCTFATASGRTVTVQTRQKDPSFNVRQLARDMASTVK